MNVLPCAIHVVRPVASLRRQSGVASYKQATSTPSDRWIRIREVSAFLGYFVTSFRFRDLANSNGRISPRDCESEIPAARADVAAGSYHNPKGHFHTN